MEARPLDHPRGRRSINEVYKPDFHLDVDSKTMSSWRNKLLQITLEILKVDGGYGGGIKIQIKLK